MSLPETITLNTDVVFDRINDTYANGKSKSLYLNKDEHISVSSPYSLEFASVQPKTNGDSLGVLRPEVKIRIATPVLNAIGETVTKIIVYTITGSVPVGFDPLIEKAARNALVDWINTTNTDYDDFMKFCEV